MANCVNRKSSKHLFKETLTTVLEPSITGSTTSSAIKYKSNKRPIIHHPRIIEWEAGESLEIRNELLSQACHLNEIDIGLPDLVHLRQYDKNYQQEVGEHHYITGIDVSNEEGPIAYLNTLWLSRALQSKENILLSMYCTFNIFSKMDIRIRFKSKKKYVIDVINFKNRSESLKLSDTLWEETFLSGFIRSITINGDITRKVPGLVEAPTVSNTGLDYCKKAIFLFCKFIPRAMESGYDPTIYNCATPIQNYIVDTLMTFLSVTRKSLFDYTLHLLANLIKEDPENEILYTLVQIKVMVQSNMHDILAVRKIYETYHKQFSSRGGSGVQELIELINLEVLFLLKKKDYELALPLAKQATLLAKDNFQAWHNLSICYIELAQYDNALCAINSMPYIAAISFLIPSLVAIIEKKYYLRPLGVAPQNTLTPREFNYLMHTTNISNLRTLIYGRILMTMPIQNGGFIDNIWNGPCIILGPIYGSKGKNITNFVTYSEFHSILDPNIIERNESHTSFSFSETQVYILLMRIINLIGWNNFLNIRSRLFVTQTKDTQIYTPFPYDPTPKHLCAKWLDRLFLSLYKDFKTCANIHIIPPDFKNTSLHCQILGMFFIRIQQFTDAVACLLTSIHASFDTITAEVLLRLYLTNHYIEKDTDAFLNTLANYCSYTSRFYDTCQLLTIRVLSKLCEEHSKEIIVSRIHGSLHKHKALVSLLNTFLNQIDSDQLLY